jgi:hypothetical protein
MISPSLTVHRRELPGVIRLRVPIPGGPAAQSRGNPIRRRQKPKTRRCGKLLRAATETLRGKIGARILSRTEGPSSGTRRCSAEFDRQPLSPPTWEAIAGGHVMLQFSGSVGAGVLT